MQNSDKWRVVAANVIAQAWRDPAYKASVLANPKAALAEAGLTLPDDFEVEAVENTAQVKNIVLPQQSQLESDAAAGTKLLNAITPLPEGVQVKLLQDTATKHHFVIPVQPPIATAPHSPEAAATAMAVGWEAVNLYTSANAVGEANAAGVTNAIGASNVAGVAEGVVVAVGAAVLP